MIQSAHISCIVIPGSEAQPSVNGDPVHNCREAAYNKQDRIPAFAGMTDGEMP